MPDTRTLLITNAEVIVTMDETRRELRGASLRVRGRQIEAIWPAGQMPPGTTADEVIAAHGHAVLPGLVNTHHHMFQSLTRAIPAAQNAELFGWLKTLYPIWAGLTPEMVRVSTQVAMAELLLSGCTTSSDHLYLYPNGVRLDHSIAAAQQIGMRFHAARGSMSVGESAGGLPPDALVEDETAILEDTQQLIETHHDHGRYAMQRVVAAPCSPFSVSPALMRESAALARSLGTRLHTHLAENDHDVAYSRARFGMTPAEYAESVGWLGDDVWHAHCVKLDAAGIARLAATGTGVAHCPCSNMRLASGIAPIRAMVDAGVPVGLGVDGSASNDGSHLLAEARQALLLQRVMGNPAGLTGLEALELATLGGAKVLGRDDIGSIEPGKCADFIGFNTNRLDYAGAQHDLQSALVFCAPQRVELSVINGRIVVEDGQLLTVDLRHVVEQHNKISSKLING
jgi:cytosine/adenosine deaminase-related metal-dependent hydrolase